MRIPLAVACFTISLAAAAVAQEPPLAAGQQVRITAPSANLDKAIVVLEAVTTEGVTVSVSTWIGTGRYHTWRRTVPHDSLVALEVSRGRQSAGRSVRRSLVKGAIIGGVAGLAMGAASDAGCEGMACGFGSLVLPPTMALLGAVSGGILGALGRPRLWERIPADTLRQIRIGTTPGAAVPNGALGAPAF